MTDARPLLTYADVARRLNVSVLTVKRMVKRGQLRARRVGRRVRFAPEWIDRYIEGIRQ